MVKQEYQNKLKNMTIAQLHLKLKKERATLKKLQDEGVDYETWGRKVYAALENIRFIQSLIEQSHLE